MTATLLLPHTIVVRENTAMNGQISETFQFWRRRKIDCIMCLFGNGMYGVFARSVI